MIGRQNIAIASERSIFWLIIAIPFVASFSSAAVEACIAALVIFFILKRIVSGDRNFIPHPVLVAFLLLIIVALLSFWNTVSIDASLQGMRKLLKYGLLLLIVFHEVRDVQHIQKIVIAAVLGLFLISLDGIYQRIFGVDFLRQNLCNVTLGIPRLTASFPHSNLFAGYLALFIPSVTPLVLYHEKGKRRLFGIAVILCALFCLFFTFCRSAALGLFLVFFLISVIRRDKALFVLLMLSVLLAPFALPGNLKDWTKTTTSVTQIFLGRDRPIIYETAFNMIRHHPFLGVGVNTFVLNYAKYKLHDAVLDPGDENLNNFVWYAHNSYLHMTAETGIMYLLVFLGLVYMLFREAVLFYRRTNHAFLKLADLGIMMGLVAFLAHGFTETNLYNPKIATLFWFQVALLMAVMRVGKEPVR